MNKNIKSKIEVVALSDNNPLNNSKFNSLMNEFVKSNFTPSAVLNLFFFLTILSFCISVGVFLFTLIIDFSLSGFILGILLFILSLLFGFLTKDLYDNLFKK